MGKKNDILQTYHERKDEFHLPLPEDGWKKLEAELADPRTKKVSFNHWWLVAAIALLGILISIPFLFQKQEDVIITNVPVIEKSEHTQEQRESTESILPKTEAVASSPPAPTFIASTVKKEPVIAIIEKEIVKEKGENKGNKINEERKEVLSSTEDNQKSIEKKEIGPQKESASTLPESITEKNKQDIKTTKGRRSIGFTTGTSALPIGNGTMSEMATSPGDMNPPPGEEYPEDTEVSSFKQTLPMLKSTQPSYIHRIPLTVGISFRQYLTDQFALESGLVYTYLYSDLKINGVSGYAGNQAIHYLGVPLKVSWQFFSNGNFSSYLSGGFMLEYCLSARQELEGMSHSLKTDRWEPSLNMSVGLQYQFYKSLALFAEPGISYYLKADERKIETIRSEHPFTFNLQLGIRFSY